MSIVSSAEIISYIGGTYTADLQVFHFAIEQMIKNKCGYEFESTSYFELYDGKGGYYRLELNHQPITAVSRVSNGYDAVIKIV